MAAFDNLYSHGFVRVAAAAPLVALADPSVNARAVLALAKQADAAGAALLVLPELSLSGYALDDLHMQDALLTAVREAVGAVVAGSAGLSPVILVGAPLRVGDALFNCALAVHRGHLLAVVPKTYLPNYREFYEKRQFAAAHDAQTSVVQIAGHSAPFGADIVLRARDVDGFVVGIEICEDLWSPAPPSTIAALAGATVIANLSASNITIGKAENRNLLCAAQSARCMGAYVYATAGRGESTTDLAWDGQLAAFELGALIAESQRFAETEQLLLADIDVARIGLERMRTPTFRDTARNHAAATRAIRSIEFTLNPDRSIARRLVRPISRFPFVPDDPARLDQDCFEAVNIQVQGLRRRLESARVQKAVIGVSGGLDSSQALLVAAHAFDRMGRPRSDIIAVTMPGFATSARTKAQATALMQALGVDAREVDIRPLAMQMLKDLDHPFSRGDPVYDVTFENVQAGLRTDYLFRLANQENGLVVGTGDLSELALGWCTYGVGDHMSHYNVNASVAKTLIQHLIRWSAARGDFGPAVSDVLLAILDTEISPELRPGDAGALQSTQSVIGPYPLQDFTLYYATRFGFAPRKIAFLAESAWCDASSGAWPTHIAAADRVAYDRAAIVAWLEVFVQRFYATSQFKRSAAPNGPKISSGGSLSPRGDWRAPSDSSAAPWLDDIARLKTELGLKS